MNTEILGVILQIVLMVALAYPLESILQKSIKDKRHGRTS